MRRLLEKLLRMEGYEVVLAGSGEQALAELLGDPAWHALMPFRLGYPTEEARLSPRRSVEAVLV